MPLPVQPRLSSPGPWTPARVINKSSLAKKTSLIYFPGNSAHPSFPLNLLCALLALLPDKRELGFLIASVVCRVSPNIAVMSWTWHSWRASETNTRCQGFSGSLGGCGARVLGEGLGPGSPGSHSPKRHGSAHHMLGRAWRGIGKVGP